MVAPAGSRGQGEALGFRVGLWPVTPALLCRPRGSRLLHHAPHLHPCKLAFSSGLFLVSLSSLLIARCWYLPALTFRFWCPDLETPPPSWPVSTVALTKAKVDPRLPACCVPPPPSVFSLIPAFPSSSHPHPFIGTLCPPLSPSEPAREPAQPCPIYTSGSVC